MGKPSASSSSISSFSCTNNSTASSSLKHYFSTDLSLGLSISPSDDQHLHSPISSLFVKVYMEGIPIGRKLDVLAHDGYRHLVKTLEHMFHTTILLGTEIEGVQAKRSHVLTYEDEEGDLIVVGDVPWEMFISTVKRLRITRV
ncbi:auxin-responsive protein IAA20 [Senna tora]|uniref:Auxin-induced protein n=1 Tax=Senna tora TaxID=362788 RepID=A0A834W5J3_9FABA|nr:auxin-responsive protein IAA20 [Senna tora]